MTGFPTLPTPGAFMGGQCHGGQKIQSAAITVIDETAEILPNNH